MQTTDYVKTVDWIISQLNPGIIEHFLSYPSSSTIENPEYASNLLKSSYDLAAIQPSLSSNPDAAKILTHFGLEHLIDRSYPLNVASALMETSSDRVGTIGYTIARSLGVFSMSSSWEALLASKGAISTFLIPDEVTRESSFDEILTIEWKYPDDINPPLEVISSSLKSIEHLYDNLATLQDIKNPKPLVVIYFTSGSKVSAHLKGDGNLIKQIKTLMLESFEALRRRKFDDAEDRHAALKSGLKAIGDIQKVADSKGISEEDANRLKALVIKDLAGLYDNRALPREVPDVQTISNIDALPPAPEMLALPPGPNEGNQQSNDNQKPKPRRSTTKQDTTKTRQTRKRN